ncbi:MAG: carboxypeptidase-like regulatory domain-containing protein [bacterium]|nr:carboxypeptidase-like regulatory domain-containing protein [bacterium]
MARFLALAAIVIAAAVGVWSLGRGDPVPLGGAGEGGVAEVSDTAHRAAPEVAQGEMRSEPQKRAPAGGGSAADGPAAAAPTATDEAAKQPAVIHSGPWLRGRVFDYSSRPIAGARLALLPVLAGRRARPAHVGENAPAAKTDEEGRFELQFADGRVRDLVVTAAGHAPVVLVVDPAALPAELSVRLPAGARIAGYLHGATPDFHVELWVPGVDESPPRTWLGTGPVCPGGQFVARAGVDAAGRFTFDDVPVGPVVVGVGPQHGAARERFELMSGELKNIELELAPPGHVAGTSRPGVTIALYSGAVNRFVTADIRGGFTFRDVAPGRYLLAAVAEPFASNLHAIVQEFEVDGRSTLARLVDIEGGRTIRVDSLEPRMVTGTVLGTAWHLGRHAVGAAVVLRPHDGVGARIRRGTVDGDGAFRIEGVPAGRYDAVLVPAGEESGALVQPCTVAAGGDVTITLVAR